MRTLWASLASLLVFAVVYVVVGSLLAGERLFPFPVTSFVPAADGPALLLALGLAGVAAWAVLRGRH